jgi:acetoacetate decarboxylase
MDVLTEGYALPVTGGFYPKPPYLYRGAKAIIALYEADPARIADLLPPGLTPLEDPPVCIAWVVHYPFSTLGVYNEAIMLIRVSFEGEAYTFCPFIYVDNDAALACGRELWGFPKKFASMGYARPAAGSPFGEQTMFTVERPTGKRLLTVTMNPERPAAAEEVSFLPALTLRRVPSSRLGAELPSICELIRTDYSMAPVLSASGTPELWSGRCSVTMDSASEFDPLYKMAPTQVLGAVYGVADVTLPLGTPVKDYLAEAGAGSKPDLKAAGLPA